MSRKLPKIISREEAAKFIAAIDTKTDTGKRDKAIITTMYRAGLRVSEICDLMPHNINLNDRVINIIQGKGKKDRNVYIDDMLLKALNAWISVREDYDYLFYSISFKSVGTQLTSRRIRQICEDLSKQTKVFLYDGKKKKPVSPHTLRHTFATECLEDGLLLHEVKNLLGHANLQTTSIYLSVRDKQIKKKIIERT